MFLFYFIKIYFWFHLNKINKQRFRNKLKVKGALPVECVWNACLLPVCTSPTDACPSRDPASLDEDC